MVCLNRAIHGLQPTRTPLTSMSLCDLNTIDHGHRPSCTIFLVICNACDTDFMAPTPGSAPTKVASTSARIVPIKAIPTVIFRHLQNKGTVNQMGDICEIAFCYIFSSIHSLELSRPNLSTTADLHQSFIRIKSKLFANTFIKSRRKFWINTSLK